MKKKTVRKVTGAKKVVSKSPQKKRFSLKAWFLGGLVLLAALAYGYFQTQPQTLKVIELAGKLEDYISPLPIDINKVTIMSDSPEVNAYVAAAQVKRDAVEKAEKNNTEVDEAQLEEAMQKAAAKAALATYQSNNASTMGILPSPKPAADGQPAQSTAEVARSEAEAAGDTAVKYVKNVDVVKNDQGQYIFEYAPKTGQVDTSGSCQTANGSTVVGGSTVIGAGDYIYQCNSDGWQVLKDAKENPIKCTAKQIQDKNCPVTLTLKPSYLLGKDEKNCYENNMIIGQDQIADTQNGKKLCDNGQLLDPKKLNGEYLSAADYDDKFRELNQRCTDNGGSWQQTAYNSGEYYCGKGNSKTCADIGKVFSEATQGCVEPGSAGDKADSKKTTPYSKAGCDNARDKNKEDCIQSADNPLLWVIVPKGANPTVNSGVYVKTSSEINSTVTNYTGTECEIAAKNTPGYTCEPILGGNYYKLTPVSQLPAPQREFVADAQGNFGAPQQDRFADSPGTLNYDTAGGFAGFIAGYNASGTPCNIYYLGGLLGVPANFYCRVRGGIAGAYAGNKLGDYIYNLNQESSSNVPVDESNLDDKLNSNVITPLGSTENGKTCTISSDCESGYCAPSTLSFIPQRCEKPPKSYSNQVGSSGKYLEGITCKSNDQCDAGLFCMKRFIGSNTCESVSKQTLSSGEPCPLTLTFGAAQSCDHCPNGYNFNSGKPFCN